MPWGPYWNQLPQAGGKAYVDQATWNAVIDNFVNWKGDVNGGGFKLSNVVLSSVTPALAYGGSIQSANSVGALKAILGSEAANQTYVRALDNGASAGVRIEQMDGTLIAFFQQGGKVGIGTSGPASTFHIKGGGEALRLETASNVSSGGSSYATWFDVTASRLAYVGFGGVNNVFDFWLDGTGKSFFFGGGGVGIGTRNVVNGYPLTIANADFNTGATTGTGVSIGFGASSGNTYTKLQAWVSGSGGAGILALNPLGGNVGIGTPASRCALEVLKNGTLNQSADGPGAITVTGLSANNATANPQFVVSSNDDMAANQWASICFQARYLAGNSSAANFAYIAGSKENATSGGLSGQLVLATRAASGGFGNAILIDSGQNCYFGGVLALSATVGSGSGSAMWIGKGAATGVSDMAFYVPSGSGMEWGVANVSKMVMTQNGNLIVGATVEHSARLQVSGSGSAYPTLGQGTGGSLFISDPGNNYGCLMGTMSDGHAYFQSQRCDGNATVYALVFQPKGGQCVFQLPASFLDAYLFNGSGGFWLDEANNRLVFRVRYAAGTLKTGYVNLS
jgi:hypothetical protein